MLCHVIVIGLIAWYSGHHLWVINDVQSVGIELYILTYMIPGSWLATAFQSSCLGRETYLVECFFTACISLPSLGEHIYSSLILIAL